MRSPARLLRRLATPARRTVPVTRYDSEVRRWVEVDETASAACATLILTTYNVWFDELHCAARYSAIADLLREHTPDVMVFQEITPKALDVFTAQPWIRNGYHSAAVTGWRTGNYGMLMLSRLSLRRVGYHRLPSRQDRGYLRADLAIDGTPVTVCCVHLDSGKASRQMRARQLTQLFGDLAPAGDVVLLGDFNMRDDENDRIADAYCDVWPSLRPDEPGFTEDTSINLMRFDMKNKTRQVRFDRVLMKGVHLAATDITLLGLQPIADDLPRIFPSDHFGVACRLSIHNP